MPLDPSPDRTDHRPSAPGLHHISVLARDGAVLRSFYEGLLGLRLVKSTVNYDDPGMRHVYFADRAGTPGTLLTFFPVPRAVRAVRGTGEAASVAWAVPAAALPAWESRLERAGLDPLHAERFGRRLLRVEDPDGLPLELVGDDDAPAVPAPEGPVPAERALRGFHAPTLRLADAGPTREVLEALGWRVHAEAAEGRARRVRLRAPGDRGAVAPWLDLLHEGRALPGRTAAGTIHHVALRVRSDEEQSALARTLRGMGLQPTAVRERTYFRSVYVREPGGVLLELATDAPGATVDEAPGALGTTLKLPARLEPERARIEAALPPFPRRPAPEARR